MLAFRRMKNPTTKVVWAERLKVGAAERPAVLYSRRRRDQKHWHNGVGLGL